MKALLIVLFASLSFSAFAAQPKVPADAVFTRVQSQAHMVGIHGYDTFLCLNAAGDVAIGGSSSWNSPLEIFVVHPNGTLEVARRVSPKDENKVIQFNLGGKALTLSLGEAKWFQSYVIYPNANVTVAPKEIAQLLSCYVRNSGLESVH